MAKSRRIKIYLRKDRRPAGPRKAASDAQRRQRYTPLQYPDNAPGTAREIGQRKRKLYRRLFNKTPVFETSATDPLARELERQAAMDPEIYRALLAQQSEFHNKPGRPTGSKTKNRRNLPKPEAEISKAARRQRRRRAKKA
jgi:hypothetical protein